MSVGISFGSATSGTGFDVAGTVSSILAVQRTPETAWATQTTALQAQDTVLSSLGSDLSSLASTLGTLTSFDGVFATKQAASSDTSTVEVTNVNSSASLGTHTLTVQQLATTSQQYSTTVTNAATLSGSLTLQVGSGSTATLQVPSGSTVAQLAAQINQAGVGVTATVINGNGGSTLSLLSNTGGSAGNIVTGGSLADSSGNAVSFQSFQTGKDAQFTLDGVAITSGTNAITSALQGVSFQLMNTTTNSVSLQVAADTSGISTALSSFVTGYNSVSKALAAQEGKDSSGNPQPLFGSPVIASLQSALSNAIGFAGSGSASDLNLASLGLSFSIDGTLSLDASQLQSELSSNFQAVASTFQAAKGLGQNFVTVLNGVGTASNGTVALAQKSNSEQETSLADDKANLETRLTAYQSQLTTELNTANQILQAIPQQLSGITQMFNAITGYKGN